MPNLHSTSWVRRVTWEGITVEVFITILFISKNVLLRAKDIRINKGYFRDNCIM